MAALRASGGGIVLGAGVVEFQQQQRPAAADGGGQLSSNRKQQQNNSDGKSNKNRVKNKRSDSTATSTTNSGPPSRTALVPPLSLEVLASGSPEQFQAYLLSDDNPPLFSARYRPTVSPRAAPIVHLGSLVLLHQSDCLYSNPSAHAALCTPHHTCRALCSCMSPAQMDRSFAIELHERDLIIDAYYVSRSLPVNDRDSEISYIAFKFEAILHLYRLLAVVDSAGSAYFLRNLLADDSTRKAFHFTSNGEDDPSTAGAGGAGVPPTPTASSRTADSSKERSSRFATSGAIPRAPAAANVPAPSRVPLSPRHAVHSVLTLHRQAHSDFTTQGSIAATGIIGGPGGSSGRKGLLPRRSKRKAASGCDELSHPSDLATVGLRAMAGADSVPLEEYLRLPVACQFPSAPLARFSCDVAAVRQSNNWRRLHNDGFELRVWVLQVPDSTTLMFRMDGVIDASIENTMSVMAEVENARNWVPYVTTPVKMGLSDCSCISRNGRFDRTTGYLFALPWPLKNRVVTLQGWLCDDIERNGSFTFCFRAFVPGQPVDFSPLTEEVTAPSNAIPIDFDGGAVLTPIDENNVFVRMIAAVDPKEKLPAVILNFFTARFMRICWASFRKVCKSAGANGDLQKARESDPWLYEYIRQRSTVAAQLREEAKRC